MEELQSSEAAAFVVEGEVEPVITKAIESHLKDQLYDDKKAPTLVNFICEDIIQGLNELGKPFKYIGAGLHTATSEFCDAVNDGVCTVKWPADKNKDSGNCACIVTVFGSAFFIS